MSKGLWQRYSTARFLQRNRVAFADLPEFEGPGPLPDLVVAGKMTVGKGCIFRTFRIKSFFTVMEGATMTIGDRCFINDGANICAAIHIEIGAFAKIGDQAGILDTTFHDVSPARPKKTAPIVIGKNVWIGNNCLILPGVTIGDHSVIAAGSIVTKSIPARSVAAGAPAKVIDAFECPDEWVRS
jgi:acetyltransferase-like isoleucine patch superfamily enzyme